MTENPTVIARSGDKPARKSSQVSTTVSPEVFEALEDHRWTVRKKMTELVAEAVTDYMAKHNIVPEGAKNVPAAPEEIKAKPQRVVKDAPQA